MKSSSRVQILEMQKNLFQKSVGERKMRRKCDISWVVGVQIYLQTDEKEPVDKENKY